MAATEQQVKVFMDERKAGKGQVAAAAKAGISERTGRRIEREGRRGRKLSMTTQFDAFGVFSDQIL